MSDESKTAEELDTTKAEAGAGSEGGDDESTLLSGKEPEGEGTLLGGEVKGEGEGAPEAKAPEKYEEFAVPDGMTLEPKALATFTDLAKQSNLPQDQAQKFLDVGIALVQSLATEIDEGWKNTRQNWRKDLMQDADFGGAKMQETITAANRVLRKYGSEPLAKWLQNSGAGDNAELVRLLARVDRATREDTLETGGQTTQDSETAGLRSLYPSMFAKK